VAARHHDTRPTYAQGTRSCASPRPMCAAPAGTSADLIVRDALARRRLHTLTDHAT
jgi:hypothetical protein